MACGDQSVLRRILFPDVDRSLLVWTNPGPDADCDRYILKMDGVERERLIKPKNMQVQLGLVSPTPGPIDLRPQTLESTVRA